MSSHTGLNNFVYQNREFIVGKYINVGLTSYAIQPEIFYVNSSISGVVREETSYRRISYNVTPYTVKTTKGKGDFIEYIYATDGAYPSNGIQGDYWYTKE